jgi:hypothetical protein
MSNVTQVLQRAGKGEGKAAEELLPLVYEELRKLVVHRMGQEQAKTYGATDSIGPRDLVKAGGRAKPALSSVSPLI